MPVETQSRAPALPDEGEIAALAARHLGARPREVTLSRLDHAFTNYVYRAEAGGRSLVAKASNNVASGTGTPLDPSHLWAEHQFLLAARGLRVEGVSVPEPIAFDERLNALLMSDFGVGVAPLSGLSEPSFSDGVVVRRAGAFLRAVHAATWPAALRERLEQGLIGEIGCRFKLGALSAHRADWSYAEPLRRPRRPGLCILDFTPQNCAPLGTGVGVFDFDFIAMADQLLDLANFQARMLFLAVLGRFAPGRSDLLDGLLIGYGAEAPGGARGAPGEWAAFCRYLAALIHYRFARDFDEETAAEHLPLVYRIYEGAYASWAELRGAFFPHLRGRCVRS